jgi:hypothetical protein
MPKNGENQSRGSNLLGVGQYNERLILQLIRQAGSLPKQKLHEKRASVPKQFQ